MLRLRPYKCKDAEKIVSWIKNEKVLRQWSADRFGDYPIKAEDINYKYLNLNGDNDDIDNFYPMTAFDETGAVGHLILRFTDEEKTSIRLGFVIVDDSKRGIGYGKEMLRLAINYAFDMLKANRVDLGVFDNNPSAYYCYKSVGFKEYGEHFCDIMGESWRCIELELKKA